MAAPRGVPHPPVNHDPAAAFSSAARPLTRVALVIGQLELGGGAEAQLAMLAGGLPKEGFLPTVISLRAGPRDRADSLEDYWARQLREHGIRVHEIRRSGNMDLRRLIPLVRVLRSERPAIVHSFMFAANAYARAASLLSGRRPILITSERTGRLPGSRMERTVDRLLERFTDGVITNARAIRRMLEERGTRIPVWVVPNGIMPRAGAAPSRAEARRRLGFDDATPLVGTVARMSAEKNYPLFVRIVAQLRDQLPGLRAVAMGDGPLRPEVERLARGAGLESTLSLLGRVPDVTEILPALDVFLLVSDYEGLSNAIMEAQALGIPSVVTDVGGNGEIVVDGGTGILVPIEATDRFADRILSILNDAPTRLRMAEEARSRTSYTFSPDRMISATAGVYRDLIARRRRNGAGSGR